MFCVQMRDKNNEISERERARATIEKEGEKELTFRVQNLFLYYSYTFKL
jgi:hypothetical protein